MPSEEEEDGATISALGVKRGDGNDFSEESISDHDALNCSSSSIEEGEEQNGHFSIQQQCNDNSLNDNAEDKQEELSVEEEEEARPDCVSKSNDKRRGVWCLFLPPGGIWNDEPPHVVSLYNNNHHAIIPCIAISHHRLTHALRDYNEL